MSSDSISARTTAPDSVPIIALSGSSLAGVFYWFCFCYCEIVVVFSYYFKSEKYFFDWDLCCFVFKVFFTWLKDACLIPTSPLLKDLNCLGMCFAETLNV